MLTARTVFLLACLTALAACHSTATAPTTTTPTTPTSSTNLFQGGVDPGGIATQTYTATVAGALTMTLANVSVDVNQPLAQALTLAAGTPDSNGACVVSVTQRAVPGLKAQLTGTVQSGTYCVTVSDPDGRLPGTVNFTVVVAAGPQTSQVTAAGSSTWATNIGLGANGSASRLVPTSAGGTLSVSLDSLSYPSGQLGLGIGVPGPGGSGCVPAQVAIGGVTTTLSALVDTGNFCVEVFNVGRTAGPVNFSSTISHP